MRLLLTSGGISNGKIKTALCELLGQDTAKTNLVYVLTAAMAEKGDHAWMVESLNQTYNLGWKSFNILDLASLPTKEVTARLEAADAIFVEGGNVYWLAKYMGKDNLKPLINKLIETKVYIGVSAGSMVFSSNLTDSVARVFGESNELEILAGEQTVPPFGFFKWYLKPHYLSKYFDSPRDEVWAKRVAAKLNFPIFFLDDQSALKIIDDKIEVITEGKWLRLDSQKKNTRLVN